MKLRDKPRRVFLNGKQILEWPRPLWRRLRIFLSYSAWEQETALLLLEQHVHSRDREDNWIHTVLDSVFGKVK